MKPADAFTCEEVSRRLDDFLDRALSTDELQRVQEHLETCVECASEYRFEGSLLSEVRRKVSRIDLPAGLKERIASRLAAAANEPER